MLEVIGAGLPRTGTTSMKAALDRLGFGPSYHMFEFLTNPDHVGRWLSVIPGTEVDWEKVFDGYLSAQDWPASLFWRELAEAYPQAKIVLTVRDPRGWYPSMRTLMALSARMLDDAAHHADPPLAATALARISHLLTVTGQATFGGGWKFGGDLSDEDAAIEAFHRHSATVQRSIRPDRLLIFDVRQGWGPLCDFLGVPAPADEPFPHLNDTDWIKQSHQQMHAQGDIVTPFNQDKATANT